MHRQRTLFAAALLAFLALPQSASAGCGDYLNMPGDHAPKRDSAPPCHGWACSGTPLAALAVPLPEAPSRPVSELPLLPGADASLIRAAAMPFPPPSEPNLSEPALAGIFRPPRP
jgi:hypothetical protein